MVNQGYTTLAEVINQLPQNFKAGASEETNNLSQIGNGSANNYSFASGINLRGLGANATLVLLNGRRLAPTALGGVVDISLIPVSLIDHIEILTDGASALYGSDAVAGVVNIITKKDFSGLEVGGRVNSIGEGKTPNYGANALGGLSWDQGNLVVDFDYEKDNPLFARNRSFTENLLDPTSLLPKNEKESFYTSLQHAFTDNLSVSADVLVSQRKFDAGLVTPGSRSFIRPAKATSTTDLCRWTTEGLSSNWRATIVERFSKEHDTNTLGYPGTGAPPSGSFPIYTH